MENYHENRFICLEPLHIPGRAGPDLWHWGVCAMRPINEIMTEDEFVRHAMRVMKLFKQKQPSDEQFLTVRMQENAPDDHFLELFRLNDINQEMIAMNDVNQEINETAAQMFALFVCEPEGHA